MSVPYPLLNFPNAPYYRELCLDFLGQDELTNFLWYGSGHTKPVQINDQANGVITLGSGSANANDYIQAQKIGATVQFNTLGRVYKFEWRVQLSDITNAQALVGVCTQGLTNLLTAVIPNGIGFYANLTNGLGPTKWIPFLANNAAVQFSNYTSPQVGPATTLNFDTLSIQVQMDGATAGCGTVGWFVNGAQIAQASSTAVAFIPSVVLANSVALGNATAVAQTLNLDYMLEMV